MWMNTKSCYQDANKSNGLTAWRGKERFLLLIFIPLPHHNLLISEAAGQNKLKWVWRGDERQYCSHPAGGQWGLLFRAGGGEGDSRGCVCVGGFYLKWLMLDYSMSSDTSAVGFNADLRRLHHPGFFSMQMFTCLFHIYYKNYCMLPLLQSADTGDFQKRWTSPCGKCHVF